MQTCQMTLFSVRGERKYLNADERKRFYKASLELREDKKLFCLLLYYTGARIQEIYNLTPRQFDFGERLIVIETLKQRKRGVYRQIPLPDYLLDMLMAFIEGIAAKSSRIWRFSLRTASRYIKRTMDDAKIFGIHSSAKGLRHGFAVNAVTKVPLTIIKQWLGHSRIQTTEIYLGVSGMEERALAESLWV